MNNAHAPAYPRPFSWDESPHSGRTEGDRPEGHEAQRGLTKREMFAAMAMQGLCANGAFFAECCGDRVEDVSERFASQARLMADALLAELAK